MVGVSKINFKILFILLIAAAESLMKYYIENYFFFFSLSIAMLFTNRLESPEANLSY